VSLQVNLCSVKTACNIHEVALTIFLVIGESIFFNESIHHCRITGVSDFIHRPDFNNYKKKNEHDVSETGSVSVLR
jgi:hypothetical protein